jgi:Flp pilus assembly protein TadG
LCTLIFNSGASVVLLRSWLTRFSDARDGATAPIFALIAIPLFGGIALAVDLTHVISKKTTLQAAADAAALASIGPGETGKGAAQAAMLANLSEAGVTASQVVFNWTSTPNRDGATVELSYRHENHFAGIVGMPWVTINATATATRGTEARVLDVAMCIDATGSMQPTINAVKNSALTFQTNLNTAFANKRLQPFDSVRVRPIFFRDFGGNGSTYSVSNGGRVDKFPNGYVARPAGDSRNLGDDVSLRAASSFFNLVTQSSEFADFVQPETESGGGDDSESGLECINAAIDSPWLKRGQSVQTVAGMKTVGEVFTLIAVWTDDDVHAPGHLASLDNQNYPPSDVMPRTYAGLKAKWQDPLKLAQSSKMLATFRPAASRTAGWQPIFEWDSYVAAGTLNEGTTQLIDKLADAVATMVSSSTMAHLSK